MTEWLLTLVAHHGAGILFVMLFFASLAMPVPASLALLAAGAFSASGEVSLPQVVAGAFAGALLGDLAAYGLGRWGGTALWQRLARRQGTGQMMDRARDLLHRHSGVAVLLSRWPFSPLGPYVNAISGATHLPALRFALLCAVGDAVWIALYLGLGRVFAASFRDVEHVMSLVVGGLGLACVIWVVARWARRAPD